MKRSIIRLMCSLWGICFAI